MTSVRIGHGYDAHRFVLNRPLMLGGVAIPFEMGLDGHSDADVLIHALCDALLGAAAMGDIGMMFPSADDSFRNAAGLDLLAGVVERLALEGFGIGNVDVTVIAERPKLDPYRQPIVHSLAGTLRIDPRFVSVKATSTDGMGFAGRGEGIAAIASALLEYP